MYHPHRKYDFHHWNIGGTEEIENGAQIVLGTSFGEGIKYVNSENFESADLRCSFGELKVFFDNAVILNQQAVIQVDVAFGSAQLFIPRTWRVENSVRTAFGDVEERGRNESTGVPSVKLIGKVSFGSIDITYI